MNRQQLTELLFRQFVLTHTPHNTLMLAYHLQAVKTGQRGACKHARLFLQRLRREYSAVSGFVQ